MPSCISKPSAVRRSGTAITPALLISTSSGPSQASAKARTEDSEARSSSRTSVSPVMLRAASWPRAVSRTASTTRAPARPSSRAVTRPRPEFAPVTTKVRPSRAGRSDAVHLLMALSLFSDVLHAVVHGDRKPL